MSVRMAVFLALGLLTSQIVRLPLSKFVKKKAQIELRPQSRLHQHIWIVYATETGNSEDFAQRLAHLLQNKSIEVQVIPIETLSQQSLCHLDSETLIVFIVATHGEGDPPYSAILFFRELQQSDAPRLDALHYAIMGLGDSHYFNFNKASETLDDSLLRRGARRICQRGLGDNAVDLEGDFEAWIRDELFPYVSQHCCVAMSLSLPGTDFSMSWKELKAAQEMKHYQISSNDVEAPRHAVSNMSHLEKWFTQSSIFKVENATELRIAPSEIESTKHIRLNLRKTLRFKLPSNRHGKHKPPDEQNCNASKLCPTQLPQYSQLLSGAQVYHTGDVFEVIAPSPDVLVQRCFQLLTKSCDASSFSLSHRVTRNATCRHRLNYTCVFEGQTIENTLRYICDLQGFVPKSTLHNLGYFLQNQADRQCLMEYLPSHLGNSNKTFLNICELLEIFFSSVNWFQSDWSLLTFLNLIPKKKPRSYSISSCREAHPDILSLTVALNYQECKVETPGLTNTKVKATVKNFANQIKPNCFGQTSSYLCQSGFYAETLLCHVLGRIVPKSLRLPAEEPLILVCAGAGIASVRALLEKIHSQLHGKVSDNVGTASAGSLMRDRTHTAACSGTCVLPHDEVVRRVALSFPSYVILIQGFRSPHSDVLYSDEIQTWATGDPPVISHLWTAYSRIVEHQRVLTRTETGMCQNTPQRYPRYVHEYVTSNELFIKYLLGERQGLMFVSGSKKLGLSIQKIQQTWDRSYRVLYDVW